MTETIKFLLSCMTVAESDMRVTALCDELGFLAAWKRYTEHREAIIGRDRQQRQRIAELEAVCALAMKPLTYISTALEEFDAEETDVAPEVIDRIRHLLGDANPEGMYVVEMERRIAELETTKARLSRQIGPLVVRIAELEKIVAAVDRELGEFSVPAYQDRGVNVLKDQYESALKHIEKLDAMVAELAGDLESWGT